MSGILRLRVGSWVLLALLLAFGHAGHARAASPLGAPKIERFTLGNGTLLFVREQPAAPLVAIDIAVHVGGRNDPGDARGLARLVAELMSAASTRHVRREDRDSVIRALGLHPWRTIVTAGSRHTRIRLTVPAHAVELALWLESDRIGFFTDGIDGRSLAAALERLRSSDAELDEVPLDRLRRRAAAAALADRGTFVGMPSFADLAKLTPARIRQHVRRSYGSNRISISIVGAIGAGRARELVTRHFGDLPRASLARLPLQTASAPSQPSVVELRGKVKTDSLCLSWRTARYGEPDDIVLDVIARILAGRFTRRLFGPGNLADRFHVQQSSQPHASVFAVCGTLAAGRELDELRAVFEQELAAVREGKLQPAEVDAGRTARLIETAGELDDATDQAGEINSFWLLKRDPAHFWKYRQAYRGVDLGAIVRVAKHWLSGTPHVMATLRSGPEAAATEATAPRPKSSGLEPAAPRRPASALRSRPPPVGPPARFPVPRVEDLRLSTGARVLLHQRADHHRLVLRVTARLQSKLPCCSVPYLLGNLLDHAVRPDGRSLRGAARDLGTWASLDFDYDGIDFTLRILPEQLESAAREVVSTIHRGKLDSRMLEDFRTGQLELLRDETPLQRYGAWASSALHVRGSRYHLPFRDRASGLERLKLTDLSRLQAQLGADSLVFSVVGAVTPEQARAALEAATKPLAARRSPKRVASRLAPGVTLVDDPEANEARVMVYVPMGRWGEAGHAESHALRWFFGTARSIEPNLADRFTEANVSNYHTDYANLHALDGVNTLVVAVTTAPSDVVPVVGGIMAQLEKLRQGAIPPAGVSSARRELLAWLAETTSDPLRLAAHLATVGTFDGPAGALASVHSRASRITRTELQTVAERHLMKDGMSVVAVGPTAEARSALEQMGFSVSMVDGKR